MTAIAAAFSPDGRDAATALRPMLDAAAHRGAQAAATWSSGSATLGYRASVGTNGVPHAAFACSPAGHAIVFDGRLDNRDDLRRALTIDTPANDAALALAAYAEWAGDAPAHLLGDFAFALWDAGKHQLVCARDAVGQRPLFYGSVAGATIVASEPQQILAHPLSAAVVNEGVIAEFLTGTAMTVDETVWKGVMRLPAAHVLIASGAGVRRHRYWDLDPEARLEYGRDEEYAEHFSDLFQTAVACRTRGASSVGVFLSGGVDSSAVAGMAQLLARERGAAPVQMFSLTFPGLAADETQYIDAVVQKWGVPSLRLVARPATRTDFQRQIDRFRDLPSGPNGTVVDALSRHVASEVEVVLTGDGADEWFTGSPLHTADLLRQGRLVRAVRQLRHDAALPTMGYTPADLLRIAASPLLPSVVRGALRPLVARARPSHAWIRPEFAAKVGLRDRLQPPVRTVCRTHVQGEMLAMSQTLDCVRGSELQDRNAAAAGLDQRHPFNDRRLVEFGFALPESQRWSGGETKVVIRRALESVLPEAVLRRNDKAEFSSTLVETLVSLGGRAFFAGLRSEAAGWVKGDISARMYDEMFTLYSRGRRSYIPLADALWSVAAVEIWLNQQQKERGV